MQRILIGSNCTLGCHDDDFLDLLIETYGCDANYWIKHLINHYNDIENRKLRMDEKLHQIVIKRNYILGKQFYEEEYKTCKIIEVPDDIQWHIEEYNCDVGEYVCENYQTWS